MDRPGAPELAKRARGGTVVTDPVTTIVGALERGGFGPRAAGQGRWMSRCPAHEDSSPSLSIGEGENGKALVKCFAGCPTPAVLEALGLTAGDLFPDGSQGKTLPTKKARRSKPPGKAFATFEEALEVIERILGPGWRFVDHWTYWDAADALEIFRVARFEDQEGNKQFRPIRETPDGWRLGDPDGPLPLYRLFDVIRAERVWIGEGEKVAHAIRTLGLAGTTSAHGANSPHKTDWSPTAGKGAVIVPDADEPGEAYAAAVLARLARLDPPPAVRVLRLQGLTVGGDIIEWLASLPEGWGPEERRAELERLAEAVPFEELPVEARPEKVRPEIAISVREDQVITAAVAALAEEPAIFHRGHQLVTVLRDGVRDRAILRPKNSPRIAALPSARLRELLAKNASWCKVRKGPHGGEVKVEAHPPEWAVLGVAARGEWPLRPLEGVVETPIIRPDGSILSKPGWDDATALLYLPGAEFPPIPANPSRQDAEGAARLILGIVQDFPFAEIPGPDGEPDGGMGHRAAWLAGLLTPLGRYAILGPCPLFLIDANTAGSGKTKLADIIAEVSTGRAMARTGYPESDEEMRKLILAIALGADRLMLLDNVPTGGALGGSSLDAALTATTIKGRILGKSEVSAEVPLHAIWYATGNNLGLRGDALRRVIPIRLESQVERPESRRDFAIPGDLLQHVRSRRGELVAAGLTILRAHAAAGWPGGELVPMDFPAWCRVVRDSIFWATGVDPCATRQELAAADPVLQGLGALIREWAELPGGHAKGRGITAAEAVRFIKTDPEGNSKLRDILMEWSRNDDLPSPKTVGMRLRGIKGRVAEGMAMRSTSYKGAQTWWAEEVEVGGSGGSGGTGPIPTRKNSDDVSVIPYRREIGGMGGNQTHQTHQTHQTEGREVGEL